MSSGLYSLLFLFCTLNTALTQQLKKVPDCYAFGTGVEPLDTHRRGVIVKALLRVASKNSFTNWEYDCEREELAILFDKEDRRSRVKGLDDVYLVKTSEHEYPLGKRFYDFLEETANIWGLDKVGYGPRFGCSYKDKVIGSSRVFYGLTCVFERLL